MKDGYGKSPYAALRFLPRRCGVRDSTPHSSGVARLASGLFAKPSAKHFNQRGVALILVLLMVSIIVALTIQLNRSQRSEIYEAANLSDGIRLRYVAQSAFYAGEAILLTDKNAFDALTEDWARTEMLALKSEGLFDNASFRLLIEDEGENPHQPPDQRKRLQHADPGPPAATSYRSLFSYGTKAGGRSHRCDQGLDRCG